MNNPMTSERVQASIDRIEQARCEAERRAGAEEARSLALRELDLVLKEEQEALAHHPYGYGHGWNVWALTVEMERLRRSKRALRYLPAALAGPP